MTDYNPFADGETRSAVLWNSMHQAHALNGVLAGCQLSAAAGSYETDVASGEAFIDGNSTNIDAQTVTHPSPDETLRLDLVTTDSTGTANVVSGEPAPQPDDGEDERPVAPDVPEGETLLGLVLVRGNATEILSGDILDEYRTTLGTVPADLVDGGEGSGLDADTLRSNYPLPNSALNNSSLAINTGNQLSGGGSVGLGGSRTISVVDGEGSGLDADTLRGDTPEDIMTVEEKAIIFAGL